MKTNYKKYMEEVWESKEQVYFDFKKSGMIHYIDFIKNELEKAGLDYKQACPEQGEGNF